MVDDPKDNYKDYLEISLIPTLGNRTISRAPGEDCFRLGKTPNPGNDTKK
jgi:hypothetical protein